MALLYFLFNMSFMIIAHIIMVGIRKNRQKMFWHRKMYMKLNIRIEKAKNAPATTSGFFVLFTSVLYFLFLSDSMSLRSVFGVMHIPMKYVNEDNMTIVSMSSPTNIDAVAIGSAKWVNPSTIPSPSTMNLAVVL